MTTATKTRYQIEAIDDDGQWNWSNVSADGVEAHTILETREEAEAAMADLVRIYQCPADEIRIVDLSGAATKYRISRLLDDGRWLWCGDGDTLNGTTAELPDEVYEFADDWRQEGEIAVGSEVYLIEHVS
jgi:hypothetical protein